MTAPRRYLPGQCHKTTRRTSEGRKFMAPDEGGLVRQIVGYLVAHAVAVSGVHLLSFVAMSNHYHEGDTDVEAKHGLFLSTLNGLLSRVFNSQLDRYDHFWDGRDPDVQKIVGLDAHIDQFLYLALNPVKAGLVPTAAEWPGFIVTPDMIGTTLTFKRPDLPFFTDGRRCSMPEEIELHIYEPPGAEEVYGPGGYAKEVAKRLAEAERAIQLERAGEAASEKGPAAPSSPRRGGSMRGFLGLAKLFETDPLNPTPRPVGTGRLNKIICNDPDLLQLELAALEEFLAQYRKALRDLRAGKKALFPAGTYALRLHYGVAVGPPPDDDERFARASVVREQMSLSQAA